MKRHTAVVVLTVLIVLAVMAAPALAQGGEDTVPAPEQIPALVNEIVNKLLVLIVSLLAAALPVLWQRAKVWAYFQYEQLPDTLRQRLEDAALLAARFVEQLDLTDQLVSGIENLAQARMETAVNYGVTLLEAQGYQVTPQTQRALQGLIENVILAGRHKKEAAVEDARAIEVGLEAVPMIEAEYSGRQTAFASSGAQG